jgi:ATP-dependent Clp protease ATP-binding subunit ClpA
MSEFVETSSVSKLLGSSPGYIGFEQGGMLTDEVDKYPYSVLLFDEIEKANPEIYNLLLQIMDEGILTDSTGKKVKFSHCIIILTSNIAVQKSKSPIGFNNLDVLTSDKFDLNIINSEFSSELISRLDKILLFNPIDSIISKIVSKNLEELASQLADKKVRFSVSNSVEQYLIKNYNVTQSGARVLDRIIDTEIKQHIADAILFGKLKNGGLVDVSYSQKQGKIIFKFKGINQKNYQELEPS